ncbi:MAG TPA: PEGA domain-containing protein, partial [Candidatus Saccharimonadales bacterium]|nr:PEGA domain-containing protein [Candidatus Saccharimonadales bacterium]
MDYLDPKHRRAYHLRLYLGYFLVAVVIGLATYIITAGLNGYGLNVKTGQIVQNGLLFVGSQPAGAEIFLNGQDQNTTSPSRLILPAGRYNLKLTKAGYRDWSRSFTLSEQSVGR